MFNLFKKLLSGSGERASSGNSTDNDAVETKKCTKCLRRISMHFVKCPYCKSSDFYAG
jgi:translation initiation factor 2 beta subunit (eIF-2beta)/eIF-5